MDNNECGRDRRPRQLDVQEYTRVADQSSDSPIPTLEKKRKKLDSDPTPEKNLIHILPFLKLQKVQFYIFLMKYYIYFSFFKETVVNEERKSLLTTYFWILVFRIQPCDKNQIRIRKSDEYL